MSSRGQLRTGDRGMNITRSGRPAVGQTAVVPGYGRCTVESNADPALVALRNERGTVLKVGEQALWRLLAGDDARPTT